MDVTPMVPEGLQVVTGYGNGGFTIGEQRHQGSVIVIPEAVLTGTWPTRRFSTSIISRRSGNWSRNRKWY